MYRFHHKLHTVEELRFGQLDFRHKPLSQILHYDTIGTGEESENPLDKMLFIPTESTPVNEILR